MANLGDASVLHGLRNHPFDRPARYHSLFAALAFATERLLSQLLQQETDPVSHFVRRTVRRDNGVTILPDTKEPEQSSGEQSTANVFYVVRPTVSRMMYIIISGNFLAGVDEGRRGGGK